MTTSLEISVINLKKMGNNKTYSSQDFGKEEVKMMQKYDLQKQDALNYFLSFIKPRLDRSYKLYVADNRDRQKEIQNWQANVSIPYAQAVVETLMPRILDARPEFTIQGRNEDDQLKANKLQKLADYLWEISKMDDTSELFIRSILIYGTGFLQVSWKKDVRTHNFLDSKKLAKGKYKWKEREQVFYDAPFCEWVDNYALMYDWHNIARESKQFWFKRLILTGAEIKRKYPDADEERLQMGFDGSGVLTDYAAIRNEVKKTHEKTIKGADRNSDNGVDAQIYQNQSDPDLKMHEVFEWTRPFEDSYAVTVNNVPILKGGSTHIIYDFKEAPFIEATYLKLPNEFEGVGIPIVLESPTVMLNMIKNQRLDAATLNIHKMWIVNPLANVDLKDLVTRPFGIIRSNDVTGVREVQFSDIKPSSYREEELLKGDMRYASGVDDFSMGVGGGASSATEVRHLRESTLERVRLFINHLGSAYSDMMRYWMCMQRQFFTKDITLRIIGEDGFESFPLIEKDDLMGEYDFKASVIPSIAGKNDIDKKQGMDLFQLLSTMPFVDPRKLTSKILHSWNWNLESISKSEDEPATIEGAIPGMDQGQLPPEDNGQVVQENPASSAISSAGDVSPEMVQKALSMLGGSIPQGSTFNEASSPINLLGNTMAVPPTAPAMVKGNPRGIANMGGKVNTQIQKKAPNDTEAQLLTRASSS